MPTYEYACKTCGQHIDVFQSFSDDPLTECPNCGGELRKVFGNIAISFKGSGFYKNDSRSDGNGHRSASNGSSNGKSTSSEGAGSGSSSEGSSSSSDGNSSSSSSSESASSSSSDGGSPAPAKKEATTSA